MSTYTVDSSNYNVNDEYYLQPNEILNTASTRSEFIYGGKRYISYIGLAPIENVVDGVTQTQNIYFSSNNNLKEYSIDGSKLKNTIKLYKAGGNTYYKKVTRNGYYLTIYPSSKANIKIKINNSYIDGTLKIKINGNWTDGSAYVKIDGSWRN